MSTPPTVGRIVHLHLDNIPCIAAVITSVDDNGHVSIHIFWPPNVNYLGRSDASFIPHDESQQQNVTWHWPERAERPVIVNTPAEERKPNREG